MTVASAVLAVLVGSAFGVLVYAVSDLQSAAQLSMRSQQLLASANEYQRLLVDIEVGERGYVLTGDRSFLAPWQEARAAFPRESRQFEQLAITPQEQVQARRIVRSAQSYIQDYSIPLVQLASRDEAAARSQVEANEGRQRADALRTEFDRLISGARQVGMSREQVAESAARRATIAGLVGVVGSALLVALFAIYLTRAIVQPIRRAAAMAGRLAGGDLSTRMPETGAGEIKELERSFNTMGSSLEQNRDELARLVDEQAALRRLATLVARAVPGSTVFQAVTQEAGSVVGADGTRMLRYEVDGSATVLAEWGQAVAEIADRDRLWRDGRDIIYHVRRSGRHTRFDRDASPANAGGDGVCDAVADEDRTHEPRVSSAVGAPVEVEGRLWGVLTAFSTKDDPLPPDTEARFADFTELVALTIANTQARADLAASRARVVTAADQTRRRIERDLHDGVQQRLVSLVLDLRGIEAELPTDRPELGEELAEVAGGLTGTLEELREVARGIHPAILSEAGLEPALRALARRAAIPVEVDVRVKTRLPQQVEVAAYYVVAEALTNAVKHARASGVEVTAYVREGWLYLSIRDDGAGGVNTDRGSGLVGLTDRVEALGGTLAITSQVGEGTELRVELPLANR
ncbi:CHASE3 domain-containing protein [Actinopolymorpha pittospori]|uniref:histidine kinase n=1 Tax=Actinopolymorpha pittospori TaxID=648752 RepID=A0A927MXE1_9ACTN|nr:CHASE3 domain-containing protein [Actinopolymorpha pittospori]MBE1608231.1 signal transduction histidine kinase [Actinopolymorpha pittospori]